jgi:deoxyribose-phosphate aldolase
MTRENLARMIDLTAVRPDTNEAEVRRLAESASAWHCAAVYTLPAFTPLLLELLGNGSQTAIGGAVGFPSGAVTTKTKLAEVEEFLQFGCTEFDMVMNFGMLISGKYDYVAREIQEVKQAAGEHIVKVILECHYLSDDLIKRASDLCLRGGADFVKTSTGWAPTGASAQNVALIKSVVGDRIGIKAAGGIRSLSALEELYEAGARRFGLGIASASKVLEQGA